MRNTAGYLFNICWAKGGVIETFAPYSHMPPVSVIVFVDPICYAPFMLACFLDLTINLFLQEIHDVVYKVPCHAYTHHIVFVG